MSASEINRRNLAPAAVPNLHEVKANLHAAMLRTIPRHRIPAKEMAHKIEASPATVESMRQNSVPDAMARLVLACLAYPEFRAEVGRLMGMRSEINPDAQKLMSELVTLMQRRP